jgi:hypothetical protein
MLVAKNKGVGFRKSVQASDIVADATIDLALSWDSVGPSGEGDAVQPVELVIAPVWPFSEIGQTFWDHRALSFDLRWSSGELMFARHLLATDALSANQAGALTLRVPANGLRMRFSARKVDLAVRLLASPTFLEGGLDVLASIVPVDTVVQPYPVPPVSGAFVAEGVTPAFFCQFPIGAREFRVSPSRIDMLDDVTLTDIILYAPDASTEIQRLDLGDVSEFAPIPFDALWWAPIANGVGADSNLIVEYR